jgi:hypothetical protein
LTKETPFSPKEESSAPSTARAPGASGNAARAPATAKAQAQRRSDLFGLTDITDFVFVKILLQRVGILRAIVHFIDDAVFVIVLRRLTCIANAVEVGIFLPFVGDFRAIVGAVEDAVFVSVFEVD